MWGGGGGVGITVNTKILGHLAVNSKTFAVTVKINNPCTTRLSLIRVKGV